MANNYLVAPVRMEAQFVETDNISVMFQSGGSNAATFNGSLAVLGGFYSDPVYGAAYGAATADINTRIATLPAADTDAGVGVIDIAGVPTVSNASGSITYRMGTQTVGLTAVAGKPVRFRKLNKDDTLIVSLDNCTAALTAGQYAIVDSATGKWKPSATKPSTGLVANVIKTGTALTQGIDTSVTTAFLQIAQLA